MNSLSFVRELVKELMQAAADDQELRKKELKMRKILTTRKYRDADDEELCKRQPEIWKILKTRNDDNEDDDDPT